MTKSLYRWPLIEREMRESMARNLYEPSFFTLIKLNESDRERYLMRCSKKLSEVLEQIRLDYEVGPVQGVSVRHMLYSTRGARCLDHLTGTPGRLAWRVTR